MAQTHCLSATLPLVGRVGAEGARVGVSVNPQRLPPSPTLPHKGGGEHARPVAPHVSPVTHLATDVLILGAGGAGLFAALHAKKANPALDVTVAVKGLLGKCGCTRMVQGGYNVALAPGDSVERHFMDTIEGGGWLNDQDLAWLLVATAPARIRELETELGCFFDRNPDGTVQLETELGCFFDRNPDGTVHQKAFAGQTFDRTVHKGDLTGIEIINRLAEQVWRLNVRRLEDHRALDLIPAADGSGLAGVLMLDIRTGAPLLVRARATLLATGGGPTMYRYHTPSGDKSCDGMAMALRAGLPLRDMEMVQFHPTGLLAGPDTRMTGTSGSCSPMTRAASGRHATSSAARSRIASAKASRARTAASGFR